MDEKGLSLFLLSRFKDVKKNGKGANRRKVLRNCKRTLICIRADPRTQPRVRGRGQWAQARYHKRAHTRHHTSCSIRVVYFMMTQVFRKGIMSKIISRNRCASCWGARGRPWERKSFSLLSDIVYTYPLSVLSFHWLTRLAYVRNEEWKHNFSQKWSVSR